MTAIISRDPRRDLPVHEDSIASFYIVAPYVGMCSALWVGAAVATLQDLVLPRMRGTGAQPISSASLVRACPWTHWAGGLPL